MSEFKISLGFDIEENSKAKIQDIIDEINAKKPEITVKVNTEQALKDIKTLQKELKKLKDINIKINTKTNQSGTRNKNTNTNANESVTKNQLSTNVNKVSWKKVDKNTNSKSSFNSDADDVEKLKIEIEQATIAYSKMLKIAKELKKHRITLEGLNISKNSREYEIVESEIQRLLISYEQLKNENKEFLKYIPDDRLKKIFEETRFEVNKLKASMEDTSEFKEIAFNFDMLRDKAKELGQIKGKLIDLDVEKNASEVAFLTQRLEELQKEYNDLLNTFRNRLSTENLIELSNIGYKSDINLERLNAKGYDVKNKVANNISDNISTKYKSDIDNIATSMIKLSNVSTELRTEFSQLQAIYNNMSVAKLNGDTEQLIGLNDEYVRTLSKVKTELKQVQNSQRTGVNISNLDFSKTKLKNDIDIWLKKNSASAKEFGATMENIKSRIQSADKITLNNLQKEFREVKQEAELAGKTGLSFGDSIKEQFKRMTSYFTLYDVYSYSKRAFTSMFNEVKNVDTAMSGLYRVTDLTTSQYNEMYNGMTESAKQYGLVLSELIDGTTTWAKLGFDGQIASQLGEVSARYQVVADTDAETAVTNLVTAYKGFQDELLNMYDGDSVKAVEYISDVFNKLGNEYAIDAEKIGIALTKSASALSISGASIQEASGMITGISEITGNPERASNALKIVSMRLRGMTGDLEELGEEVDDDVKSISQMQTKILNFTHGKVNIFDDAGEFRNIYDIFDDIAEIYFDLTSTEQAGLIETIAGKFLPEYTEMCI